MRLSETRTPYIIFKTNVFDKSTLINCAIVKLPHIADVLLNADIALNLMKPARDFQSVCFRCDALSFLFVDSDEHECIDDLGEEKIWSFIDITEEELNKLIFEQETPIEAGFLAADVWGRMKFLAYVKHSGVEVATEHFTLEQLGIETGR